jgi:tetratricopeptide (TPR) repeat protein
MDLEAKFISQAQTFVPPVGVDSLGLVPSDFGESRWPDVDRTWTAALNRYRYAQKVGELHPKFGRVQAAIVDLEPLVRHFPIAPSLNRVMGYLHYLNGNNRSSLEHFTKAAAESGTAEDWHNLAAVSLIAADGPQACYSLGRCFGLVGIRGSPDTWALFVGLLLKLGITDNLADIVSRHYGDPEEADALLEGAVCVLGATGKRDLAEKTLQSRIDETPASALLLEVSANLPLVNTETYERVAKRFEALDQASHIEGSTRPPSAVAEPQVPSPVAPPGPRESERPQAGHIYNYGGAGYGFIRGADGRNLFFHMTAVKDKELLEIIGRWRPSGRPVEVFFESAGGPRGPVAVVVTLRRTPDEQLKLAHKHAEAGEYNEAIAQVKRVLALDPLRADALELHERWRAFARITGLPKGSNPYARAKRAQMIEEDLERALSLYQEALDRNDNAEAAVKDMASIYAQRQQREKAVEVLLANRTRVKDQQAVDNMLVGFYQNLGKYAEALDLLRMRLGRAQSQADRATLLWQIAKCHAGRSDYEAAEQGFRDILKLQPRNNPAKRNLGICLFRQNCLDEAASILESLRGIQPDTEVDELLEAIAEARTTGLTAQVDEELLQDVLADVSGSLSGFSKFLLERCQIVGVPPKRVKERAFLETDARRLEERGEATARTKARTRAAHYMSAARVSQELGLSTDQGASRVFRLLGRALSMMGDTAVQEHRHPDCARSLYCEALVAFDADRTEDEVDPEAKRTLTRYLYSTLERWTGESVESPSAALEEVFRKHPSPDQVMDYVGYLVLQSHFAASAILRLLHGTRTWLNLSVEYLRRRSMEPTHSVRDLDEFIAQWKRLRSRNSMEYRELVAELRGLGQVPLASGPVEDALSRMSQLESRFPLELDRERIAELRSILATVLDMCEETLFEEKDHKANRVVARCAELQQEIERGPTKVSVEGLYDAAQALQQKVQEWLERLYRESEPDLELKLAVDAYPAKKDIVARIGVANGPGRSPAESLELVVLEQGELFSMQTPPVKAERTLRGGDRQELLAPLTVLPEALQSQAFSLPVYAEYRTRGGSDVQRTKIYNFYIKLYPDQKEPMENPYVPEAGPVDSESMFYGRRDLIQQAIDALSNPQQRTASLAFFGQKRAGKSSVLLHLKRRLEADPRMLPLYLGNMGDFLDDHSRVPLLYQILWTILSCLERVVSEAETSRTKPLGFTCGTDVEFYEHPTPLTRFRDLVAAFHSEAARHSDWKEIRPVLMIDEFTYVHGRLVSGKLPEDFMKNWKAILQSGRFSCVLVGQDVMRKLKNRFPNELGTVQDLTVGYLAESDARALIDEPIRIGGPGGESRYKEQAVDHILELTAKSPFYIQIVCHRLVNFLNDQHERYITKSHVEQVLETLVAGDQKLGQDKFDNLLTSGDTSADAISEADALAVLRVIAQSVGTTGRACSRSSIAAETSAPIDAILADLVERSVLERERGAYYMIRVGLFAEWLRVNS